MLPRPRALFTPTLWLAVLIGLSACDRQVSSEYEGESMLRMGGRIVAPLNLENQGLRPVVSFSAFDRPGVVTTYTHERIVAVTVQGMFPSGFSVDLRQPPPADTLANRVGGEPAYAEGRLMVVGPGFPSVVSPLRSDPRPIPECGKHDRCFRRSLCEGVLARDDETIEQDGELPAGQACLSRIEICVRDEEDPLADLTCTITREEGDPKLHMAGYADRILILYFSEPVEADTYLAVSYNADDPISAGYHAYLLPEQSTRSVVVSPEPEMRTPSCWQQVEADLIAEYNAEHGTDHQHEPTFPGQQDDPTLFEYFEWQRKIYREMRKRGCEHPRLLPELGPDDLVEISLEPGAPQPL